MKKGYLYLVTVSACLSFTFLSCMVGDGDRDDGGTRPGYASVHAVGTSQSGSRITPLFWRNGVQYTLNAATGFDATPFSVHVSSSNNVFIAGSEESISNYSYYPVLWKNGTRQRLSTTYWGEARSAFVVGNDVYAAGYCDFQELITPVIWKNETMIPLDFSGISAWAESVYVAGNNEYAVGCMVDYFYSNYRGQAMLWENGRPLSLSAPGSRYNAYIDDFEYNKATSVHGNFVAGNVLDTYTGNFVATLWINGLPQSLTNGNFDAYASSVFVQGLDVYVAGHEYNAFDQPVARLWKNGIAQSFGNQNSVAYSVFVSGYDVFVAGIQLNTEGNWVATLWQNGIPQTLAGGANHSAAYSVFVR